MRDIEKCNCLRRISRYRPAGVYIWVSLPCTCLVSVLSHDKSWYKLQSKNLMEERKPRYSFLSPPFKCSSWEARNPSCIISHPPLPGSPLPQAYNCLPNIWTIISTLLLLWSCCHISEDMFLIKIISDEKYFSLSYRCIWNILLSEMSVLSPLQRRVCSSLLLWLLHMIAPLSCSDCSIWLLLSPALTAPYDCSSLLLWRHHMIAPVFAGQVSAPPGQFWEKSLRWHSQATTRQTGTTWTRAITSTTSSFYGLSKVQESSMSYCERIYITMLCDRKYTL